jgi:hypothetical protein
VLHHRRLRGHYFYADYCRGWVRSFRLANGKVADRRQWEVGSVGNIASFGEDGNGEFYLLSAAGRVLRVMPAQ